MFKNYSSVYSSCYILQNVCKPVFCGRLVDCTAAQGSHVKIVCCTAGTPDPMVEWFKDGVSLTASPR